MKPVFLLIVLATLLSTGCRRGMFNQPRSRPLRESSLFPDGAGSRPLPPHTVAQGHGNDNDTFSTGLAGTNLAVAFPLPVTHELLERGRERFEINCSPCHGRTGNGDGLVVQHGFPAPPSYHIDRLRQAPIGHFFDVMTRGYGVMYPQASRVEVSDRWAIAAYIRALQLHENARPADVPPDQNAQLQPPPE